MTSPEFILQPGSTISWRQAGGATDDPLVANISDVPVCSLNNAGFQGLGLRRVATGEYVLDRGRPGNGDFTAVEWTAAELATVAAMYPGEKFVVDFVDYSHGSWGWALIDDVRIDALLSDPTYGGLVPTVIASDPDGNDTIVRTSIVSSASVTNDCMVTVYRTWEVEDCCGLIGRADEIYSYALTPEIMAATLEDLDLGCISSSNNIPPPDFIAAGTMASCGAVKISLSNQAAVGVGYMTTPNALMHYAYDENDDSQLNFHNGGGLFNGGLFCPARDIFGFDPLYRWSGWERPGLR